MTPSRAVRGLGAYTRRAAVGLLVSGLLSVSSLAGAVGLPGIRSVDASGCTITVYITGNPMSHSVRAHASWSGCAPSDYNRLSVYEQIGPDQWSEMYHELEPSGNYSNVSAPEFASGWNCYGVGYWKARAYIAGIIKWSTGIYCP